MILRLTLLTACLVLTATTLTLHGPSAENSKQIHGRIVRYAWTYHELTMNDDFVVKTSAGTGEKVAYIRVVWLPQGFELPPDKNLQLDRLAFVGRGPAWTFSVHSPSVGYCTKIPPDKEVEDELGKTTIPNFVPTPGAENESVPPINDLPCYVLNPRGMIPDKGATH
jgi:hypothetical protein